MAMNPANAKPRNSLLAALPETEWERVREQFKPILMTQGDVLYEPGMPLQHCYFPLTSAISIACVMAGGREDAVVLVGHEGFASIEVFLGSDSATRRAVVRSAGRAYEVKREWLRRECAGGSPIHHLLLRYTQSYITQVAQTVVCNRHHSVDQQLSRWLLMFLDRQESNELAITQEHVATLMGVRRESVTEAAGRLQFGGAIRCRRGRISVVDRAALEVHSCECYGVVRRETERLIGVTHRDTPVTASLPAADRGRHGPAVHAAFELATSCA
jgi:CRP-like cAMP-binding protein